MSYTTARLSVVHPSSESHLSNKDEQARESADNDRGSVASTTSYSTRSGTFRSPGVSLRSRLPWLDGDNKPRTPVNEEVTHAANARSNHPTIVLPMTVVHSNPPDRPPPPPPVVKSPKQNNDGSASKSLSAHLGLQPRQRQISSSQYSASLPSHGIGHSARKDPIRLAMRPATSGALRSESAIPASTATTPGKEAFENPFKDNERLGKLAIRSGSNESLPELDVSPLTKAITHLENLMQEAEDLVNEAAEGGVAPSAIEPIEPCNEETRPFNNSSPSVVQEVPPVRPFLVDARISELSLDESEVHGANRPDQSSPESPIIRDFATHQSRAQLRKHSEHWLGHRTLKTPKSKRIGQKLEDIKESMGARIGHKTPNAKVSNTQHSAHGNPPLRHRKKVQILEAEKPVDWSEWSKPRPNTYFNKAWDPNTPQSFNRTRKLSIPPVPWNEKVNRRRGHRKLSKGADVDRDVEKTGVSADDRSDYEGHHSERWQLGHAEIDPIARKWSPMRKRIAAVIACLNTAMVGYAVGDYAGMVPRIQFQVADQAHNVLMGNVYLFLGMAVTTFFCWPLPLLHGRRPYILASLGLAIPLQFPQAIVVSQFRSPILLQFEVGLLTSRFVTGLLLGLTNINDFAILLDLFGASLQSEFPHQEIVTYNDPRRDGGGIGVWLGIWVCCWVGSVSIGFTSGASIINNYNPEWGFFISVSLMVAVLVFNVIAPETRHSSLRRTRTGRIKGSEGDGVTSPAIARGEIKLHIDDEGPEYWFQELWAGVVLSKRMFFQRGFAILSLYLGWIYGQNILVIVLLGALLSRDYRLPSRYVGLGVLSIAIGALLAVPMTHAGFFGRSRSSGPRTDSMTFEPQLTWTSHMVRRISFMLMLPVVGLIYTFTSPGNEVHFMIPIVFAGAIGFFDSLAVAECYGLIMETFDTSDLQPGVNSRHRLQSLSDEVRKRRTNYSSFPRVSAGIFLSQTFGFLFAAAATGIGGIMTRNLGAQYSTGVTAGILMLLTFLLTGALFRYRNVQVIPNHAFGTPVGTFEGTPQMYDANWKPVVIGNPSGKVRRMSLLELGQWSRWTEIRRLNKLLDS